MHARGISCPNCREKVGPEDRFCDSCGAMLTPPPSCLSCGSPWVPGARFCEKCGAPLGLPSQAAPAPVSGAPARRDSGKDTSADPGNGAQNNQPVTFRKNGTDPKKTIVPGKIRTSIIYPLLTIFGRSRFRWDRICLVVIVLATLCGLLLVTFSATHPPEEEPAATGAAVATDTAAATPLPTTSAIPPTGTPIATSEQSLAAIQTNEPPSIIQPEILPIKSSEPEMNTLIPEPTRTPPSNTNLVFQVDKDSVSGDITVRLAGGFGRSVMKNAVVRVYRQDGSTGSGTIEPSKNIHEVTISGIRGTDRVTVTAYFYSGQTYPVIDQIMDFPKKM